MSTLIRYILLTALRDRLFFVLPVVMLIAFGIAYGLSRTSMIEEQAMAIAFVAASMRIILAIGVAIFVCFHVRQAFDAKEIDVMLSRPISRETLLLAYWVGFGIVSVLLALPAIILVYVLHPFNLPSFGLWVASLMLELWIVVAVALFASMTLRSAVTSVIFAIALYVLARLMGYFLATVKSKIIFQQELANMLARNGLKGLAIFVPRLDMFAKTSWLVYGVPSIQEILFFMAQSLVIIPLLLVVSIHDLYRRQF